MCDWANKSLSSASAVRGCCGGGGLALRDRLVKKVFQAPLREWVVAWNVIAFVSAVFTFSPLFFFLVADVVEMAFFIWEARSGRWKDRRSVGVACAATGEVLGRLKRNTLLAFLVAGVIIVLGGVVGGGRRTSLTKHACEEQIDDVNIITDHYDNDYIILYDYFKSMYPR